MHVFCTECSLEGNFYNYIFILTLHLQHFVLNAHSIIRVNKVKGSYKKGSIILLIFDQSQKREEDRKLLLKLVLTQAKNAEGQLISE